MRFKPTKAGLAFTAVVDPTKGPQTFLLRTKVPLEARHLAPAELDDAGAP